MAATTRVGSIKKHFRRLKDPRVVGRTRHRLSDIIVLAICGVIANCDDWPDIALFAETRLDSGPKSSVNVGLIEGGSGVNAIAQAARCKVDIRSESNARMDQLVEVLGSAVDRARDLENQRAATGKISAKVKEIGWRPAAALPENAPILQYIRAVDAHLGIRSRLDCSSTDANIPISMGVPAIAIGAGCTCAANAGAEAGWCEYEGASAAAVCPSGAVFGAKSSMLCAARSGTTLLRDGWTGRAPCMASQLGCGGRRGSDVGRAPVGAAGPAGSTS